ncbi:MAG: phosphoribosylamine--glycine ligase [Fervidicoccaceae archaeon]
MGVGSGAREHAIAEALARSAREPKIFWAGDLRNPGIFRLVERTGGRYALVNTNDARRVADLAAEWSVDLVVVGPEEPNFHGIPDEVEKLGIPCVGAKRRLAVLEMSKAEMRRIQWRHGIPGRLLFKVYKSYEEALADLSRRADDPTWLQNVALKPARQAGGRGVKVIEDSQVYLREEKRDFKRRHVEWLEKYVELYGDIEEKILVEEKVWGPEYTLQCATDGRTVLGMPLVQDNKHAHDFDIGPETGGMGSYTGRGMLLPFITIEEYERSLEIVRRMVEAIQRETGELYKGFVAGQMMLTEIEGPTLIEMYSRLGDPEALNVLVTMETDFLDLLEAIVDGRLASLKLEFSEEATVVKAVAPKGYPDFKEIARGHPIAVNEEELRSRGCRVYWGSVHLFDDGSMMTGGSRAVELLASAATPQEASRLLDECLETGAVKLLDGWGLFYRRDIGSEEMVARRTRLAERARALYKYREKRGLLGRRVDWIPKVGKVDPSIEMMKEALAERG